MVAKQERKKLSPEEAEVEYARSEKGLRFQLIEGRAMAQSDIKITFEDLKHSLQKISVSKWHNSEILRTKKFRNCC
jgi:hypothetical protein